MDSTPAAGDDHPAATPGVACTDPDGHRHHVRVTPGRVEAWSVERLQFQPGDAGRCLRTQLVHSLPGLTVAPGDVLHAVYVSADPARVDAENVLLYNVGPGAFAPAASRGVRFERVIADPPPSAVVEGARHYHAYAGASAREGFARWEPQRQLAAWADVDVPAAGELTATRVWYALRRALVASASAGAGGAPEGFGLRVALHGVGARPRNAAGLVKPVFDGVIAALHRWPAPTADIVAAIAAVLGKESDHVRDLFAAEAAPLGDRSSLVRRRGAGFAWNPADERCVAGELLLDSRGSAPTLSGELVAVRRRREPPSAAR